MPYGTYIKWVQSAYNGTTYPGYQATRITGPVRTDPYYGMLDQIFYLAGPRMMERTRSGTNSPSYRAIANKQVAKPHSTLKTIVYRDKKGVKLPVISLRYIKKRVKKVVVYFKTDRSKGRYPEKYVDFRGQTRIRYRFPRKRFEKIVYVTRRIPVRTIKYKYMLVTRQKLVYGKKQRSVFRPFGLLPNPLSFTKATLERFGARTLIGTGSYGGQKYYRYYYGDVDLQLIYSYPNAVNYQSNWVVPDNHSSQTLITDYYSEIQDLEAKVIGRFYSKVANCHVNAAQALAEAGQTASLIGSTISRLARAIAALRRGNIIKAIKTIGPNSPKGVAQDVLAFQYGVRPLISDIDGALKKLAEAENLEFDVIATATKEVPLQTFTQSLTTGPRHTNRLSKKAIVTVRYKARLRISNQKLREAATLGFTNPANILWELTPWSFVVDWLIPIGNWLQSLSAFDGVTVVSWHKTYSVKQSLTFTRVFGGTDDDGFNWAPVTCGWTKDNIQIQRIVGSGQLPKAPRPRIKNPFSTEHVINAIALLTSLKGK